MAKFKTNGTEDMIIFICQPVVCSFWLHTTLGVSRLYQWLKCHRTQRNAVPPLLSNAFPSLIAGGAHHQQTGPKAESIVPTSDFSITAGLSCIAFALFGRSVAEGPSDATAKFVSYVNQDQDLGRAYGAQSPSTGENQRWFYVRNVA